LNIRKIFSILKIGLSDLKDMAFASLKITKKISSLESEDEIKLFIQQRSALVTQTTLYGYLKTRIGTRYLSMFEDDKFSESIEIAKWNIYLVALADCTLYVYSFLIDKKGLKEVNVGKIFSEILLSEKSNGLDDKLIREANLEFEQRLREVNWSSYHATDPFIKSGQALYRWSPIADELKVLDKEIVLNSIMLKWNLVKNEFLELTKKL
jgi:hypothetical protein